MPPLLAVRTPRRMGFTIPEVMMAGMVLALCISGAIVVMQRGLTALDTARNTTLASQVIQSEMERIRLLSWSSVTALPESATLDISSIFPASTTTNTLIQRFSVTRTSSDVSGKAGEMKTITITLTWQGLDGIAHTRSTTTQYSKDGVYDYFYTKARS